MLEEQKKDVPSRFQRHVSILIWKSYNQRQRRWRLLVLETLIAGVLFLVAVYCAKPVFLTPLQAEPEAPKTSSELLASLDVKTDLYYTPAVEPFTTYMKYAARLLNIDVTGGKSEEDLSNILYNRTKGSPITNPVVWVVWKPKRGNQFRISIRSTERARHQQVHLEGSLLRSQHLRAGFLAVQLAISEAIIKLTTKAVPEHEFSLVAMPVSPLMEKTKVNHSISWIMLCFTLAFVPPVMELVLLVVKETTNGFKRGLRIRNVGYPSMYIGWLVYAYLTALPICILASITIIFIFRWINLLFTLFFIFSYISVMIMISLNMAMFHKNPWVACVWNALLTLLQTFLAELLVHHRYEEIHTGLTFLLNIVLPPLALVHGFNNFALLQTGHGSGASAGDLPLSYTIALWCVLILLYFGILILLQRTIGRQRAIGGQVSWKSIIFKRAKDENALRYIESPSGKERDNLQEVDDLVAKAITFRNVSKSIMDEPVLKNLTLDIYRSEFTLLFTERINEVVLSTLEDLLLGLTFPDSGTINVLGQNLNKGRNFVTMTQMLGYCHSSKFLIEDLTVQEHLVFFIKLCLWQESGQFIIEYSHMRLKRLISEFDLEEVRDAYIGDLHSYYRAQLCWAIAMLLEPRIVIIPYQFDNPICKAVTNDKIMKYKKRVTLVKLEFASYNLEFADRFFIFDNKTLVFGGTPAYIFFKYGREYRVRLSFRSGLEEEVSMRKLLERAEKAGASVRAHLGSLLILRVPATPTAVVAELMQEFTTKAPSYGITSMNLSLPDSEEVCRRAIIASRAAAKDVTSDVVMVTHREDALKNISEARVWRREETCILNRSQFEKVAWKFTTFYLQHKIALIVTVMAAIVTGAFIGYSLAKVLLFIIEVHSTSSLLHGEVLTVESLKMKTNLVIRSDMSDDAFSVAHGYVLSETYATQEEIKNMQYSALSDKESLTEYLVTRAIHSPQHYVYMYAYGMDITLKNKTKLRVQALYSPLHWDQASAARSMSRVFMALLRYYSGQLDASIEITDDPLELDLTPGMKQALLPPLLVQFLLILTISHVTLIPSQEHGLIRHLQSHAANFSPVKYWFSLFVCDMILYWILVGLMAVSMVTTMLFILPMKYFHFEDLLAVPLMLIIYGLGCIPQAYLFSLGPRPALNTMMFVMVNVVFGETTILAKLLYGDLYNYAVNFMSLSPQFNMAIAFVKIKQIFLYNSECVIFKHKKICSSKILHKCCEKCGVMQECFSKQSYFGAKYGVLMEIIATLSTAVMYATLLLLWEYKYIQQAWYTASAKWMMPKKGPAQTSSVEASPQVAPGVKQEIELVLEKMDPIRKKNSQKIDTFGENLLACNVGKINGGVRVVRNLFLGLARGEAVALSGLKRHGRVQMCEVLAGYKLPSEGVLWSKSKWNVKSDPHLYAREISFCGEESPLPPWMTVRDGLELLAVMRGVPNKYVREEVNNYIEVVDLGNEAQLLIRDLSRNDKTRLHFAAAVVAAPPVVILDECTAYQKFSVRRSMYSILYFLRQRGHSILTASSSVESHLPVTNRLAIVLDGRMYDIDHVDRLVERYSRKGYTVVLHLKDEVDVKKIFAKYFNKFVINDLTVVLVNVQVLDGGLNWAQIFAKMESLQAENSQVYSYIVSATPIEYVYNSILSREQGNAVTSRLLPCTLLQKLVEDKPKIAPPKAKLDKLVPFEKKYNITKLKDLPWSVIFQR